MSDRELSVSVNDVHMGTLRESNDLWAFEYSETWAASPKSFDLSPALNRAQALHTDGASLRPVQWYFDNLLPEEAMRIVLAKEARVPGEDAFGLLSYFGAESAGSLVLVDLKHPRSTERGLKPLPLSGLSERIANLPRASLTQGAPKKMSLAGAQHKLLVVLKNQELFEPLPGTPSTHILKPNHLGPDYTASAINEYFCMRLGHALGLPVPVVTRMYVPQPVYIVERFDRVHRGGDDSAQRRHAIDTCQLLNKARMFKSIGAQVRTLLEAAEQCREKAAARLQLFKWLLFNLLIGNGDNHLKNISFIVDAAGIHIAPAYDMLSTCAYDTKAIAQERAHWPQSPLEVPLGAAGMFAEVRRAHVMEAARELKVSAATAKRILDRMLKDILSEADRLIAEIRRENEAILSGGSGRRNYVGDAIATSMAGEVRLLDVSRHIVIAEMVRQLE